jgi:hypothetical protein
MYRRSFIHQWDVLNDNGEVKVCNGPGAPPSPLLDAPDDHHRAARHLPGGLLSNP